MSITHISPVYDLGQRADYLQHGVGAKRREHRARGTDRIAPGFHCDAESIDAFIAQGNALASSHGRRVKAHSIIVSFSAEELSVRSAADLQLVGDMGLELARRAFPNSPSMVVVHDDAKGGNPHAHVTVLNHDLTTGKAPVKNRTHAQIARLNDQLMKESGLSVVSDKYVERQRDWSARRDALPAFDRWIGDQVVAARDAALTGELDTFDERFADECKARGVDVVRTEHKVKTDARRGVRQGDVLVGIEYHAKDDKTPGKAPRRRRRAASRLSSELTKEGLDRAMAAERQRRAAEAQQRAHEAAQRARVAGLRAVGLGTDSTPEKPAQRRAMTLKEMRAAMAEWPSTARASAPAGAADPRSAPVAEEAVREDHVAPLATAPGETADTRSAPAVEEESEVPDAAGALAPLPPTAGMEGDETVGDVPRSAPTAEPGPPLATAPGAPYRSPVRDEHVRARDVEFRDRVAALDEHVVQRRADDEGLDGEVLDGMTPKKVQRYGALLHADTLEVLEWKQQMTVAARMEHLNGREYAAKRIRGDIQAGRIRSMERVQLVQDLDLETRGLDEPELN